MKKNNDTGDEYNDKEIQIIEENNKVHLDDSI